MPRRVRDALGVKQFSELRGSKLGRELIECALLRILVGAPAQETGAVTEAPAGDLIVADFGDQRGLERLPFGRALGLPPARAARRASR